VGCRVAFRGACRCCESRRSSFGKDLVTAGLVLRIGSATNPVTRLAKSSGQRYISRASFDCGNTPLNPNTREFTLKIFDLLGIHVAAGAGLCGATLAFSAGAAAAPLPTGGGPTCVQQMSGLAAPVAAAPAPVVLPGPPPGAVPAGAPVLGGAPATAPVPAAAAPLLPQAGTGKGVPTGPALTAGPVVLPGPPPVPTPTPPAPVTGATLVSATGPLAPCCNP
jgi:hypothetical protein